MILSKRTVTLLFTMSIETLAELAILYFIIKELKKRN